MGDTCQLPAFQHSKCDINAALKNLLQEIHSLLLNEQYRQPANLAAFGSCFFYQGQIRSPGNPSEKSKQSLRMFVWRASKPLPLEERQSTPEALLVKEILTNYRPMSSVLTFYANQRRILRKHLPPKTDVLVVDASQGSSLPPTILSPGRHDGKIGFCGDKRRFNVAESRTRKEFIVVCHESMVDGSCGSAPAKFWNTMYEVWKSKNLVYDIDTNGNLSYDLQQAFATDLEYSAEDVCKSVTPYHRYQAKLVGRIFPDMEAPGLPLEAVVGDAQDNDEDDPM